ncbi:MAG: hypothetical protein R3A52_27065 [Polyangiales bacterium]
MVLVTVLMLLRLGVECSKTVAAVGATPAHRDAVYALCRWFRAVWLICMAGFCVALTAGALVVRWSQRRLAERIETLTRFGAVLGSERSPPSTRPRSSRPTRSAGSRARSSRCQEPRAA